MHINRKQLKRDTKAAIHDGKPSIIWIGLVFILLCLVLEFLSMSVTGEWELLGDMVESVLSGGDLTVPETESSLAGEVLTFALSIMSIMLSVGFSIACLNTARRVGASFGNLFDSFSMLLRAFCVVLLRSILLSLWSMLAFVPWALLLMLSTTASNWLVTLLWIPLMLPAVRAFYSYRQAVYLMIDNPGLNAIQCLQASRQLMNGHKWELFKLDLSLLGWYVLCIIPAAILWVLPYAGVCYAGYYDRIIDRYAAEHKPEAAEASQETGPEDGRE